MGYKIAFSKMTLAEKIPDGSPLWPEFNSSFVNCELDTIDIANQIYTGHPFTTWHRNGWRVADNYQMGQHIGIDFDTEDRCSTLTYLAKDKFIQKYAALIYTTPSHRIDAPRARVLFLLDTPIHQAKNYALTVASLLWLFGTADRKCKDVCRFFYGSKDCDVEYFPENVLPLEKARSIMGQYQATGEVAKKVNTKPHVTPPDQQEVSDALKAIPAWAIDYNEWVCILMAIHSGFGDAGLPLAEQWAQGKDKEVERKFRSFKANGNGTGQVTLNTVFKMAHDRGWKAA
jgi:hypothetical protein